MSLIIIITVLLSISFFLNVVLIKSNKELKKETELAIKEAQAYQDLFNKYKEKARKQEKQNQDRMTNLANEVAKLKKLPLDEIWRRF